VSHFDEDSMPTPCAGCGEIFDLHDGKPCRKCHIVFCAECARWTESQGWRCYGCLPAFEELEDDQ
jgi:hypothetical protein